MITKIDIVESRLRKKYANFNFEDKQKEFVIAEQIDAIVNRISTKLNVPREQIDFIENYNAGNTERNLKVEYYLLKMFKKVIDEGLRFIQSESKQKWCRTF